MAEAYRQMLDRLGRRLRGPPAAAFGPPVVPPGRHGSLPMATGLATGDFTLSADGGAPVQAAAAGAAPAVGARAAAAAR